MASGGTGAAKLALLIDGDNIPATYMPIILREAERLGTVAIRRVYGQFGAGRMKAWTRRLEEFRLTRVDVTPLTKGKNATDMKLVVEAMDILLGRRVDGFCIASSDRDFLPLIMRMRASAHACYGFGVKGAMAAYKDSFDRFVELDTLAAGEKRTGARKSAPGKAGTETPRHAAPPVREVLAAIDARGGADGWAALGSLGQDLQKAIAGFTLKTYGKRTLRKLIEAIPNLELRETGGGPQVRRARD